MASRYGARDSQRQRVYDAEQLAWFNAAARCEMPAEWHTTGELPDVATAQAYIDAALANETIRKTFGRSACAKVEVYYGGQGASGDFYGGRIRLGTQTRSNAVALHELAHVITGRYYRDNLKKLEAHGPQFCAVYLLLVRVIMGDKPANDLRAAFELKGCRFAKLWEPVTDC